MEERWELMRWITGFIEDNQEQWEIEKLERDQEWRSRIEYWDKSERFKKIAMIREREKEKKVTKKGDLGEEEWVWERWRRGETRETETDVGNEECEKIRDRNYECGMRKAKNKNKPKCGNEWDPKLGPECEIDIKKVDCKVRITECAQPEMSKLECGKSDETELEKTMPKYLEIKCKVGTRNIRKIRTECGQTEISECGKDEDTEIKKKSECVVAGRIDEESKLKLRSECTLAELENSKINEVEKSKSESAQIEFKSNKQFEKVELSEYGKVRPECAQTELKLSKINEKEKLKSKSAKDELEKIEKVEPSEQTKSTSEV